MAELTDLTLSALQAELRAGAVAPRDALEALARRIEVVDGGLGGYLHYDLESALAEAERADVGKPLGGIPIAIKDLINVRGQPCTCGSRILDGYIAPYDASVITRLRAAGAIPFGRTNMDEFAMGSSNENSALKPARNPWDASRIPGGSSGGSAVVVAAREAWGALGSDTGGSIRQPAALCGCVGLKPSYGRVSRYGLTAFASSLDQIGPLTRTVDDAALLFEAIAGHDPLDSTSLDERVPACAGDGGESLAGVRLGLPAEYFGDGVDPDVRDCVMAAVDHCAGLGAEVVEISLPHSEHAVAVYYIIATAEASSNLARFDGVRYGRRARNPADLLDHYGRTRDDGFGDEVKRRIILGTYVLSSGYHDAYYTRAQKARTLIRRDFASAFERVDAIVGPTSPTPAFKLGERADNPLTMYLSDIFTIAANLAGICGLSVPCGFATVDSRALPVGLQLLCPSLAERKLLDIARVYQRTTSHHQQPAPLT